MVTTVASSDSVLSMTASAYDAGTPATASRTSDDLVAVVDRVHHQVGDRDVDRDADDDDRRDAEVAQHRIEVGAGHRVEAVNPRQHEVARSRRANSGDDLGRPPCRGRCGTGDRRIAPNSRALRLEPRSSGRRPAVQWTTGTPAVARGRAHPRSVGDHRCSRPPPASSGSTESAPMTPFWHSLVTTAVCAGSTGPRGRAASRDESRASRTPRAAMLAGLHVVDGRLHVVERVARRHQLVELEPARW